MVMVSVRSGGLFLNPALCLAGTYYSIKELEPSNNQNYAYLLFYIVAQFTGGILAGFLNEIHTECIKKMEATPPVKKIGLLDEEW